MALDEAQTQARAAGLVFHAQREVWFLEAHPSFVAVARERPEYDLWSLPSLGIRYIEGEAEALSQYLASLPR